MCRRNTHHSLCVQRAVQPRVCVALMLGATDEEEDRKGGFSVDSFSWFGQCMMRSRRLRFSYRGGRGVRHSTVIAWRGAAWWSIITHATGHSVARGGLSCLKEVYSQLGNMIRVISTMRHLGFEEQRMRSQRIFITKEESYGKSRLEFLWSFQTLS